MVVKNANLSAPPRAKREALTGRIADALLEAGVAQIPLRDLADRLGTSDRMLLYYFDDKADLIRSSLQEISRRLAVTLANATESRSPPDRLLRTVLPLFASPQVDRSMRVWADLSARSARGEEPFVTIGRRSVEAWLSWLETRLAVDDEAERRLTAAAILTIIEGMRQLETSLPTSTEGVATLLARAFSGQRSGTS